MIQAESLPLLLPPSPLRSAPIKKGQTKHQYNTPPSPLSPPLSPLSCLSSLPTRHSSQKTSPRTSHRTDLWVSFLSPTFMTNTPKKTPHATYIPWPPPPTRPTRHTRQSLRLPTKNNKALYVCSPPRSATPEGSQTPSQREGIRQRVCRACPSAKGSRCENWVYASRIQIQMLRRSSM